MSEHKATEGVVMWAVKGPDGGIINVGYTLEDAWRDVVPRTLPSIVWLKERDAWVRAGRRCVRVRITEVASEP